MILQFKKMSMDCSLSREKQMLKTINSTNHQMYKKVSFHNYQSESCKSMTMYLESLLRPMLICQTKAIVSNWFSQSIQKSNSI